jgi:hypothetical protein
VPTGPVGCTPPTVCLVLPLLGDHLEEALSMLGLSCEEFEID